MAWIVPSLPKIVIDFSFAIVTITENVTPQVIMSSLFKKEIGNIYIIAKWIISHNENIVWRAHILNILTETVT